jgi:hypothetical protein
MNVAGALTLMLTACPAKPSVAPGGEGGDGSGSNGATSELAEPTDESIGGFKNGDPMSKAEELFGPPESKEEFWEEGATGDVIAEWAWKTKGLSITAMKYADGVIGRGIYVEAPCTAKTSRGVGIGSTWAEVDALYAPFKGQGLNPDEGEQVTWGPEKIIVGSVYGGTIFTFTDGKVSSIFVGAAAE